VRALQVAAQAAGVFVTAAAPRRIIFLFCYYDDAGKAADVCRFCNCKTLATFFRNIIPVHPDSSFVLL
jgi:hypothetical protein